MKTAKLLHNAGAGGNDHPKQELMALIESVGIHCRYSSTKTKSWKSVDSSTDFLIVAGGDGTIRKVVSWLVNRPLLQKPLPIAVLPLGTANNIAQTLNVSGPVEQLVQQWANSTVGPFDVGLVNGLAGPNSFFLESIGYGLFTHLMLEMKKQDKAIIDTPQKELELALALFEDILSTFQPQHYEIEVDGVDYSGKYLWVEIINIRSIGPNLEIAPDANPSDGWLDVVLVSENDREQLASYIRQKRRGSSQSYRGHTLKARQVNLRSPDTQAHIDDKLINIPDATMLSIEPRAGLLSFLIPAVQS